MEDKYKDIGTSLRMEKNIFIETLVYIITFWGILLKLCLMGLPSQFFKDSFPYHTTAFKIFNQGSMNQALTTNPL